MSDDHDRHIEPSAEPVVVEAVPVEGQRPRRSERRAEPPTAETITEPAKLLRIASMVRELLDETRQASLDEAGRTRLADVYQRAVGELSEVLSPDLQEELGDLAPPLEGVPSESEIRVAQAQLVGLARGLVPRHPGGDVRPAGGRSPAVRGAPPTRPREPEPPSPGNQAGDGQAPDGSAAQRPVPLARNDRQRASAVDAFVTERAARPDHAFRGAAEPLREVAPERATAT